MGHLTILILRETVAIIREFSPPPSAGFMPTAVPVLQPQIDGDYPIPDQPRLDLIVARGRDEALGPPGESVDREVYPAYFSFFSRTTVHLSFLLIRTSGWVMVVRRRKAEEKTIAKPITPITGQAWRKNDQD